MSIDLAKQLEAEILKKFKYYRECYTGTLTTVDDFPQTKKLQGRIASIRECESWMQQVIQEYVDAVQSGKEWLPE